MMTIEHAIQNVDEVVAKARVTSMRLMKEAEQRFIDSITARDAMTTEQAIALLEDHRDAAMDQLDHEMQRLREWILRGDTDSH